MITLLVQEGQTCNQLLSLSALLSLGIENGCDVKCPVVDNQLFEMFEFDNKTNIKVLFYHSKYTGVLKILIKVLKRITHNDFAKTFDSKNVQKPQYFLNWLSYLDNDSYIHNVDSIRTFFKVKSEIYDLCKKNYDIIKVNCTVVGVHLRRGDYKIYKKGIWYYDDDTYIKWMKSLKESYEGKLKFVLCSNEKIDLERYKMEGLDVTNPGRNSIEDLTYLGLCDYVMGPPSSYSFWAAMYGNKRRCILDDRNKEYTWRDFRYFEERLSTGDYIR